MSNSTQLQKAEQRRNKFAELLREMFQLNQPELDFGLYRIMHARKDDINRFIEQDLPSITRQAFEQFASLDKTQAEQALEQARKAAVDAGFDPEQSPKVKELQAQLKDNFDLAREEGEVYDALVTFFNRYYSEGDFLSRRVYKDGTYAIPYQGEEVVLHWANKDQYYIKSSEILRDYAFRLNPNAGEGEDPLRVHFKLVDAEAGAKDNNKESDSSKRVFVLDTENPFELIDGEPNGEGEPFKELQLRFFFRAATMDDWTPEAQAKATASAQKKPPTQDHLRTIAVEQLLGTASELSEPWKSALARPYVKADGESADYSTLQGQLNNYTKKNTFDYFIHKDLGGFLTRELDFYIKNELMDWADIAALKNDPARLAPLLSKIEVIRTLGEKIIAFLAQLENFQKKLWLKKKFVTETQYCITLDRIEAHTDLLNAVFANDKQRADWEDLYKLDLDELEKDLKQAQGDYSQLLAEPKYRFLMLDTAHFDDAFKADLLSTIEDLDEQCDGLLVHSENFQALNLLQERFKGEIKFVYADPPYNTDAGPIVYKNGYRVSSWNSLMSDRLHAVRDLLADDGILCATIDDYQQRELDYILQGIFGRKNYLGTVTIRSNPSGRPVPKGFAQSHEYAIFYRFKEQGSIGLLPRTKQQMARYRHSDESGAYMWELFRKRGSNSERVDRPSLYYPIFVKGSSLRIPSMSWDENSREWVLEEEPSAGEEVVFPVDSNGVLRRWRGAPDGVKALISDYKAEYKDGEIIIYYKFRPKSEGVLPLTTWNDPKYSATEHGTGFIKQYFREYNVFSYPKSIHAVRDCIEVVVSPGSQRQYVIDFFAGSGTTGHAAIQRSRAGHKTNYILVEMGGYFSTVILPRIKKAVYSDEWISGTPRNDEKGTGISQTVKYFRLEGYEDTLGNLSLNNSSSQQSLLASSPTSSENFARQSYIASYMLEVETRGSQSLLNTDQFLEPTQYQLNVRSASGDETKTINVDLLETFNYLLGLRVEHIAAPLHFDAEITQGEHGRWIATVKRNAEGRWWFRTVYGTNPNGEKVVVVWRNLPSVIAGSEKGLEHDNAVLDAVLLEKLQIRLTESQDDEVDILYVKAHLNI